MNKDKTLFQHVNSARILLFSAGPGIGSTPNLAESPDKAHQSRPKSESRSVMSNSLQPHGLYSPRDSPGQDTGVGSLFLLQGIFPTQIKPRSPTLQVDSLPVEPQGKPNSTGVGSLFLQQGILLTQESNRGFLHCRWILYQLSYPSQT